MNAAIELLRNKAQQMYDSIVGESKIELLIDPVEETTTNRKEATAYILDTDTTVMSEALMQSANVAYDPSMENLNWTFKQQGKVKVWIYNTNHQGCVLGNGFIKKLIVPACPQDAEYVVATSIPAVMIQPKDNADNDCIDYVMFDGRRVAMDLIDPENFGTDQDANFGRSRSLSSGTNFSMRGVFFSTHNPPLKKEIKAAHRRLKVYYTELMERANIVRLLDASPALGVSVEELKSAQQYVEDSSGNK